MEWKTFINNIKEILDLNRFNNSKVIKWETNDEIINIQIVGKESITEFVYTKEEFDLNGCSNLPINDFCLHENNYYEAPVTIKRNSFLPISFFIDHTMPMTFEDKENEIHYEIHYASNKFLFKIVEEKCIPNNTFFLKRIERDPDRLGDELLNKKNSLFELLRLLYKNTITLKIKSKSNISMKAFEDLVNSLLFTINYNSDLGLVRNYDIINAKNTKVTKFRNVQLSGISEPKRKYKKELVDQYNMAISSTDPFTQYLCYYHILEHYYEEVYTKELINSVQTLITSPSFSVKSDKHINSVIELIKNKLKREREEYSGNELEALELVIKKYIKIEELEKKLNEIDENLMNYYTTKSISFSNGNNINFMDQEKLNKSLANRIYKTRNALVHYKSNDNKVKEKGFYKPFQNKEELSLEIPLIRLLAEEVIINNSSLINL